MTNPENLDGRNGFEADRERARRAGHKGGTAKGERYAMERRMREWFQGRVKDTVGISSKMREILIDKFNLDEDATIEEIYKAATLMHGLKNPKFFIDLFDRAYGKAKEFVEIEDVTPTKSLKDMSDEELEKIVDAENQEGTGDGGENREGQEGTGPAAP